MIRPPLAFLSALLSVSLSMGATSASAADEDIPEEPETRKQVDAESAELEEMRALEESTLRSTASRAQPDPSLPTAAHRLGVGNPVGERLRDALEGAYGEEAE